MSLKQAYIIDWQLSDLSKEVYEEIRRMIEDRNDVGQNTYMKWDKWEDPEEYPIIARYLTEHGVPDDAYILILVWW